MPKFPQGGRVRVSTSTPPLFESQRPISSETKYYGLIRDNALSDIEEPLEALSEVLRDIQNPAEANTLGIFTAPDLQIIEGILRYDLKREDFEVLQNASINIEDENGNLSPAINPRQRIADRIKQSESFAGRGTVYQGQGTVMYKYMVPTDDVDSVSGNKYSHTTPPPFYTEAVDSTAENAPDHIPTLSQLPDSHRIGTIVNGTFEPRKENEYWWSGAYFTDVRDRSEYGADEDSAALNPKFPIVRDGNLKFGEVDIAGITQETNWGLRFDTWFKAGEFQNDETFLKFAAFVNGHLRIDYFEKTGYDGSGVVQGTWKTALDTTDSNKYYIQDDKETTLSDNTLRYARRFVQGGPFTATGGGTGATHVPRTANNGGSWDLSSTHPDQEANDVNTFEDYVPVVIRFWYGQKDTETVGLDPLVREPAGQAGFVLDFVTTDAADITTWNDYSSQMRVQYDSANGYWARTAGVDTDFSNFNDIFEVVAYSAEVTQPSSVEDYEYTPIFISGVKNDGDPTKIEFSIPDVSPSNGDQLWVIIKNRPFTAPPEGELGRGGNEVWQRYLFHPDLSGNYSSINDMLKGVGSNYTEPDPAKEVFTLNYDYYKARYGNLPAPNTYGPDRYDGFIPTTITSAAGVRDYDYDHNKLLMIGRQKKGTVAQIGDGTTNPNKVGKDLATGEVRKDGENYTFLRVIKNEAGFGGNVIINAYPTNNLSVLTTSATDQFAKFLHMGDNTTTYSNGDRQSISTISRVTYPSDPDRLKYEVIGGRGVLSLWTGGAYDTTGAIAKLTLGAATRDVDTKSIFIVNFKNASNTTYNFYGFIGATREAFENQQVTVNAGGSTITSSAMFPNNGETGNNNQYIGSQIEFLDGDGGSVVDTRYVTAYDASTETVTFGIPTKSATNYYVNVWHNHFKLGGEFPNNVVDVNGNPQTYTISDGDLIQISNVFNSGYQFERADRGDGLNFSETLFFKPSPSPTASRPFSSDTEAPAPAADIVTPFGYDNTPSASDPGLGGLCYPPYRMQNIELQYLIKSDSELYSEAEGNFDLWWGGRNVSLTDLDNKSLTVTDKLLFDFAPSDRAGLISSLASSAKPAFTGSEYTHKLEVELNVEIPDGTSQGNPNLYIDAIKHSNGKPVKDKFYLFINRSGSDLEVISANLPNWSA